MNDETKLELGTVVLQQWNGSDRVRLTNLPAFHLIRADEVTPRDSVISNHYHYTLQALGRGTVVPIVQLSDRIQPDTEFSVLSIPVAREALSSTIKLGNYISLVLSPNDPSKGSQAIVSDVLLLAAVNDADNPALIVALNNDDLTTIAAHLA